MRVSSVAVVLSAFVLSASFGVGARGQTGERVARTWTGTGSASVARGLRERRARGEASVAVDTSVLKFTPAGDSGVVKAVADALGGSARERAALAEALTLFKKGYEAEVAKDGKSNNLAVAFAFFITASVMAYRQSDAPLDRATELLLKDLEGVIAAAPEFARMSNAEKQRTHDWLVCVGGFTLAGYGEARRTGDAAALAVYRDLAEHTLRLVLGVEAGKLNFKGDEFLIEPEQPAPGGKANNF